MPATRKRRVVNRFCPRAFTLIELLVVIAIIAVLVSLLLPALRNARRTAREVVCTTHLQQFARAYASYANDFHDAIASLTGDPDDPNLHELHQPREAATRQVKTLINRVDTRRPTPIGDFPPTSSEMSVAEQWEHLALIGYASTDVQMPIAICPEDAARLEWYKHPFNSSLWTYKPKRVNNKAATDYFPYSSSYQLAPAAAAYSITRFGGMPYRQANTHDTYVLTKVQFGHRSMSQVSFPSQKVAMMDSQQRHYGKNLFYAYPIAKQPLLFWDGSVSIHTTKDSNKGWLPDASQGRWGPDLGPTTFQYVPDPGFESPRAATSNPTLTGYYRWTASGLHGIDFGGTEINSYADEIGAVQ